MVVFSITTLDKLKIDDPVGAISVHGVVGLLGLLLVPVTNDGASFSGQIIGALTIFGWVFVTSAVAFFLIKMVMGLRVSEEEEYEGVDVSECGMEAYPSFPPPSNYPVLSWQFGPLGALFLARVRCENGSRPGDQNEPVICEKWSPRIPSLSGIAKNPFSRIMEPQNKGIFS